MHILRYKELSMMSHRHCFIHKKDDARWWASLLHSGDKELINWKSRPLIRWSNHHLLLSSTSCRQKNGPGNSDIQACKEIQLKQCACAALESWRGPFQTWIQHTYIHALEGLAGSWSIESHWWCFAITCGSAFQHHKLYTVHRGRPESPHAHHLLMDVLALIWHALMEGHLSSIKSHT